MVSWLADFGRARSLGARVKALGGLRPGYLKPVISLLKGLKDPIVGLSMGQTAEKVAHRFSISRERMDEFALQSHNRLAAAIDNGQLDHEIEPIFDAKGTVYEYDNGLRRDSSLEKLASLRPIFDRSVGNVTAGNSSQITDGSAMLILASEEALKRYDLEPMGRIVDTQWAGLDPAQMGLGPVHATTPVLNRHSLALSDIDYWEINEAFAAQVLGCLEAWKSDAYCRDELGQDGALGDIDMERLNINGGSVAIGHPVGASGARIVLHLLNVLKQKNASRGVATICIGGGQGGTVLLERTA